MKGQAISQMVCGFFPEWTVDAPWWSARSSFLALVAWCPNPDIFLQLFLFQQIDPVKCTLYFVQGTLLVQPSLPIYVVEGFEVDLPPFVWCAGRRVDGVSPVSVIMVPV